MLTWDSAKTEDLPCQNIWCGLQVHIILETLALKVRSQSHVRLRLGRWKGHARGHSMVGLWVTLFTGSWNLVFPYPLKVHQSLNLMFLGSFYQLNWLFNISRILCYLMVNYTRGRSNFCQTVSSFCLYSL